MHFKEIVMLTNNTMLTISGRDTTSPIGIQFRPFIYNVPLNIIKGVPQFTFI